MPKTNGSRLSGSCLRRMTCQAITDIAFSKDDSFLAISRLYSSSGHPDPVGAIKVLDFKDEKVGQSVFSRDVPTRAVTFLAQDTLALVGTAVEVLNFKTGEATVLLKDAPSRPHW